MQQTKICSRCATEKPHADFFKRSRAKDGLRSECKTCTNIDNAEYKKRHPEVLALASKNWIERHPEKRREIKKNWAVANKEKISAMNKKQQQKRQRARAEHREHFPRLYRENGAKKSARELIAMAFPKTKKDRQEWYARHAPKLRNKVTAWANQNREYLRKKGSEYQKANRSQRLALHAAYRARKFKATPSWANRDDIRTFYELARALTEATGVPHHVDHQVPLNNPKVQGLHVADNLCILTGPENAAKGNRRWPDMWGEQPPLFD